MSQENKVSSSRYYSILGAAAAAALVGCGAPVAERVASKAPKQGTAQFPEYRAKDLNGKMVTVPGDGESSHVLVLVAFKRKQQRQIDRWLKQAKPMMGNQTLDFLELPVIRKMNPISRWFVDRGMRGGIRDSHTRARVVTLFTDKSAFRRALSIPDEDSIYVYLVRRADRAILWQVRGDVSPARMGELTRMLGLKRQARL